MTGGTVEKEMMV
jgi:hypothetical protein